MRAIGEARRNTYLYLVLGASAYLVYQAASYRLACPAIIRAANYNPVTRGEEVMGGLYLHLALMLGGLVMPLLLMTPFTAYYISSRGLGAPRTLAYRMLRYGALALYIPSAAATAIVLLAYRLLTDKVLEDFMYAASTTTLLYSALYIYASVLAIPWDAARTLPASRRPGIGSTALIGASSALIANLAGWIAGGAAGLYNAVIWRCSAEDLGVTVFNANTRILEELYTVDTRFAASTMLVAALYYLALARLLAGSGREDRMV